MYPVIAYLVLVVDLQLANMQNIQPIRIGIFSEPAPTAMGITAVYVLRSKTGSDYGVAKAKLIASMKSDPSLNWVFPYLQ